jgi:hypothetical protein
VIDAMGFDLTTADGYAAWRAAGGRWPCETDEVMQRYEAARAAEVQHEEAA